ncbi:MAG: DEAD/DEAH box helicase family protein [Candidatus Magasanikbacteria bacterium]|nr:DEAD/DEAH box helicase family protein [Candidatus Magasanikbacteria bacterium]
MSERLSPYHGEVAVKQSGVDEQQELAAARLSVEEKGDEVRELRSHQVDFVDRFVEYFKEVVNSRKQGNDSVDMHMARVVSAPRTGKTTIAAEILRRTDLGAVFFAPSTNLIDQAVKELEELLPGKIIVKYTGKEKGDLEGADIIVATYQISQANIRTQDSLPVELRTKPLVFADEGHESTTESRIRIMREEFDPHAIRIALTGTPDYSESRKLEHFYPNLIGSISIPEAVSLDMLSPFQYWVYELDLDGSEIDLSGGDYKAEDMGRLITGLPVFKLMEKIRYDKGNKDIPGLICFRVKQQAEDARAYLERLRPEEAVRVAVITEDTKDRAKKLQDYLDGKYDTLITVRVLLQGWDAERCKLLIDFDPTTSPVRAGQKFTRPLTKSQFEDQKIAKIYSVVPSKLKYPPLLPPNILLDRDDVDLPVGKVIGTVKKDNQSTESKVLPLPERVENVNVRLVANIREYGGLGAVKIDRGNQAQIREIINTGLINDNTNETEDAQLMEVLHSYRNFQNTFFKHPAFTGYGRILLWSIGVKNKEDFKNMVTEFFPEQRGTMLLLQADKGYLLPKKDKRREVISAAIGERSVSEDFEHLANELVKYPDSIEARQGLRTLLGPGLNEVYRLEDVNDPLLNRAILKAFEDLRPIEAFILIETINGATLKEIGERGGLRIGRERVRQILKRAVDKMRQALSKELVDSGIATEPDPDPGIEADKERHKKEKELEKIEFTLKDRLIKLVGFTPENLINILPYEFRRRGFSEEKFDQLYSDSAKTLRVGFSEKELELFVRKFIKQDFSKKDPQSQAQTELLQKIDSDIQAAVEALESTFFRLIEQEADGFKALIPTRSLLLNDTHLQDLKLKITQEVDEIIALIAVEKDNLNFGRFKEALESSVKRVEKLTEQFDIYYRF